MKEQFESNSSSSEGSVEVICVENGIFQDLAPHIYRQRLCIEGLYSIEIHAETVSDFLSKLSEKLGMTVTHGPVVQNEAENINPKHKGFEGVILWAESGTHLYTWENGKFFTLDVYSCSKYDDDDILEFTREYFESTKMQYRSTSSQ